MIGNIHHFTTGRSGSPTPTIVYDEVKFFFVCWGCVGVGYYRPTENFNKKQLSKRFRDEVNCHTVRSGVVVSCEDSEISSS